MTHNEIGRMSAAEIATYLDEAGILPDLLACIEENILVDAMPFLSAEAVSELASKVPTQQLADVFDEAGHLKRMVAQQFDECAGYIADGLRGSAADEFIVELAGAGTLPDFTALLRAVDYKRRGQAVKAMEALLDWYDRA